MSYPPSKETTPLTKDHENHENANAQETPPPSYAEAKGVPLPYMTPPSQHKENPIPYAPTTTTVFVVPLEFNSKPAEVMCPYCNVQVTTRTEKILENCKPTEFVQNIDEFKAKVASIFGQIKQDGDILFKVIDEYQNFQDLPSTSNEIPIMEENINTQEFNEPSSSHNLSIDDENETISIKSVKSENSSSQSLDSLLYPELESEVDQLLQVNDETPIIHSQQSPNATRVRHQPTVQSHSVSLRNTTNIAAYD
uniref:LITAF domain-containing protein n=1 Tax=Acrobeloides nanus TaxID=290746 RepID=A0A914E6P8_9BILA